MPSPNKNAMLLPADLTKRLLSAEAERDIRQATLDNILGSGIDLSTEAAVSYVDSATAAILAASNAYDECMVEVVALAREKGGYDPAICSPIQASNVHNTGAVSWTVIKAGDAG